MADEQFGARIRLRVTEARLSLGSDAGQGGPADIEPELRMEAVTDHTYLRTLQGRDLSDLPWHITVEGPNSPSAGHRNASGEAPAVLGWLSHEQLFESSQGRLPEHFRVVVTLGPQTLRDLVDALRLGVMPEIVMLTVHGADESEATPEGLEVTWDIASDFELEVSEFFVASTTPFAPVKRPPEPAAAGS